MQVYCLEPNNRGQMPLSPSQINVPGPLRLMGQPQYICRCNQRRDWHIFFCFCPVILQKKAQAQQTREFHKKSIKEKAVHLSGLFTGDGPAEVKVTAGSVIAPPLASPAACSSPCGTHLVLPVIWSFSSTTFRHPELCQRSGAWVCSTANIPFDWSKT